MSDATTIPILADGDTGYGNFNNVRRLVRKLEQSVIDVLAQYDIAAYGKIDAPGVYVMREGIEAKIAALGLRIRNGCSYHGLAFNEDMDLSPFSNINPCGYQGLKVTQCAEVGVTAQLEELHAELTQNLVHGLHICSHGGSSGWNRRP